MLDKLNNLRWHHTWTFIFIYMEKREMHEKELGSNLLATVAADGCDFVQLNYIALRCDTDFFSVVVRHLYFYCLLKADFCFHPFWLFLSF